jgi:hypothetical protein
MFRAAISVVWLLALTSSSYSAQISATALPNSSETGLVTVEGEFLSLSHLEATFAVLSKTGLASNRINSSQKWGR